MIKGTETAFPLAKLFGTFQCEGLLVSLKYPLAIFSIRPISQKILLPSKERQIYFNIIFKKGLRGLWEGG
jgi:hypothetical protein